MNDSGDSGPTRHERLLVFVRVLSDAATYAVTVALAVTLGAVVLSITTGGGLVRGKNFLFVSGWILMAYATVQLWPSSPKNSEKPQELYRGRSIPNPDNLTRFQRFVRRLPPRRWTQSPPPDSRITVEGKLFYSAVLALFISFVMETWLGVV